MTKIYNAYETKRKCEKLYSDIICFNIHNLPTKNAQWKLYNEKINEIVNEVEGEYDSLNIYDEIFTIGNKIDIYYMNIKTAIIKSITVKYNTCTGCLNLSLYQKIFTIIVFIKRLMILVSTWHERLIKIS